MYGKFPIVELAVLLVLLTVGAAHAQYDFEGCGELVMDVEGGCIIFRPHTGGSYTLDDYGDFQDGVTVHVVGDFGTIGNPCNLCGTFLYPCIHNVSISECQTTTGCCQGRVGDANGLLGEEPTIGDISVIVDAKFVSGDPNTIACLGEADVNSSGGADPTIADISIGDISILIDYLFLTGPQLGLSDCYAESPWDNTDLGDPDSLIATVFPSTVGVGESTVSLFIFSYNDVQYLANMSAGFTWDNPKAHLDSAVWSPATQSAFFKYQYYKDDLDSSNLHRRMQCTAMPFSPPSGIAPSQERQLLATYYFSLNNWTESDYLCITSDPYIAMRFVDPDHAEYSPTWYPSECVFYGVDTDGDGVGDDGDRSGVVGDKPCAGGTARYCDDNCIGTNNPMQEDGDGDGIGNVCDNCPNNSNVGQDDSDLDGLGDVCDVCDGFDDNLDADDDTVPDGCDICAGSDDRIDTDSDGVPDGCDNCPSTSNPGQANSDGDIHGDPCDLCPGFDDALDSDADRTPDDCDICDDYNDSADADGDGIPDGCDLCAGYDDAYDDDSDGIPDGCDLCPGFDDSNDKDSDSVPDSCDNCPDTPNAEQIDTDGNGIGDACCCSGRVGDVNQSGEDEPKISDLSLLIDNLFITGVELPCLFEADVNQSGGINPLPRNITIGDVSTLIDYLFITGPSLGLAECL